MSLGSNTSRKLLVLSLIVLAVWIFRKKAIMKKIDKKVFEYLIALKQEGFSSDVAKMIISQAAFETGNFTSRIFKQNHNLFGMKLPKLRNTLATGEKFGHATFNSDFDSIKDYKLYWVNFSHPEQFESLRSFIERLKSKGYFEADIENYFKGVEYYHKLYWNE